MFNVGLYVKVKFRAFFIDFGTIEKAWTLGVTQGQPLSVLEIPTNQVPSATRKIYDQRGLTVKVW